MNKHLHVWKQEKKKEGKGREGRDGWGREVGI